MKQLNNEAISILQDLYNLVWLEEIGHAERVSDYFSSAELKEVLDELEIPIKASLDDVEIEEVINDYFESYPEIKTFNLRHVNNTFDWTEFNSVDKKMIIKGIQEKYNNEV